MITLPKGERKKKKEEYCVPNKTEARMQECKCVTGCYWDFGCKKKKT